SCIGGCGHDDVRERECACSVRDSRMRNEGRGSSESRARVLIEHFPQIIQALAAGDGDGVDASLVPRFRETRGTRRWPGAPVAFDIVDLRSPRTETAAEKLASAAAAKDDDALARNGRQPGQG